MTRLALLLFAAAATGMAAENNGFVPLFNGRDLTGWVNVNCAPETWTVRDGVIHCTGKPTGALRTDRQFENFILELEWRHLSSGGNSGVFLWGAPLAAPGTPFLRSIEVQVLDNGFDARGKNESYTTHGDVFPIHGATMEPFGRHRGMRSFPSEERSRPSPEWNHYRILCTNGVVRLSVNGKEVSGGSNCNYRKGYLALESEGGPVEFRNVRVRELASSGVSAAMTAPLDQGFRPLFNGIDFRGWKTNSATAERWQVRGEMLALKAGAASGGATLWTEPEFGDAEFIIDCRPAKPAEGREAAVPVVRFGSPEGKQADLPLAGTVPGQYRRFIITRQGRDVTVAQHDKADQQKLFAIQLTESLRLGLAAVDGAVEFMNIYVRNL